MPELALRNRHAHNGRRRFIEVGMNVFRPGGPTAPKTNRFKRVACLGRD